MLLDHDDWEPSPEELDEVLNEIREEEEDQASAERSRDMNGIEHAGPGNADASNHRQALFQKYLQSEWAPANRRN